MRKQLYNALIAQLGLIQKDIHGAYITAPVPVTNQQKADAKAKAVIKHFDIWNNQIENIEIDIPFERPAIFLQFQPIQWEQRSKGIRGADVGVTLHVVTDLRQPSNSKSGYDDKAFEFFDLLDAINYNLYGLKGDFFRNVIAVSSATDHDHADILDSQETYSIQCTDHSAVRSVILAPATPRVNASLQ